MKRKYDTSFVCLCVCVRLNMINAPQGDDESMLTAALPDQANSTRSRLLKLIG